MQRYVCIHGHFYQPPRENPWLEAIEPQDSAYPYHDWNERITAECYAANAASRILDEQGRIVSIADNYAKMSFNVGPTLLSWMEEKAPETYQALLNADRESARRFSGHGSATAQAYGHLIMPLANSRDKRTQVVWGIRDFQRRFGRDPEGMWLPETAVDLESLDLMAEHGIRFTVLAPHQAARVRRRGEAEWRDVNGGAIDPTVPYEVNLPSGRRIALFFYDGPISRAIAFEGLLSSGEHFARRLVSAFSDAHPGPQLVHTATDGETYGHHHRFGDMALAHALDYLEEQQLARVTNYGEYLGLHPPVHEVQIHESSSWSCAHGVERWRANCGCNTGMHAGWTQAWRAPLREALDWLRDALAEPFERRAGELLRDPWAARDDYIEVILDRAPESLQRFVRRHAGRRLDKQDQTVLLKLMECQRHALLMYTSCGWFFDDISGIEAVQVLQYAGRALQLAEELFGVPLQTRFVEMLKRAPSNLPLFGNAKRVYERLVLPARVGLKDVAAHFGVSSVFQDYPDRAQIYSYSVEQSSYQRHEAGRASLALGRGRFTSVLTGESADLTFGVLHFGDHNVTAGVREVDGTEGYTALVQEAKRLFSVTDFPAVLRLLDRYFEGSTYSLRSLFREEQRKILERILASPLEQIENSYRQNFEFHAPLLRFLNDLPNPPPRALQMTAEFVVNTDLRRAFSEPLDFDRIQALLEEAQACHIELDAVGLAHTLEQTIDRLSEVLADRPHHLLLLQTLEAVVRLTGSLPFKVDLWKTQNVHWSLLNSTYPRYRQRAQEDDATAQAWVSYFLALGDLLGFRTPAQVQ